MWVLVFIFNFLIGAWFYSSAKEVGKNKTLWFFIGLFTCFFLGLLFRKFGELYFLPRVETVSDALQNRHIYSRLLLYIQIVTMILISGYAYLVRTLFLSKKKS